MYETFWNLHRPPFDDGANADFYFPGRSHQAALLKLRYLVDQRKGLAIVVGEHGLGKTHLTHVFDAELTAAGLGPVVRLLFPQLGPSQTLVYLAQRLGAEMPRTLSEAEILAALETRLAQLRSAGKSPVFVIDDAHLLEIEHLQLIRLLLNFREAGLADFSVVLSGRPELLTQTRSLGALDQRAVLRAALSPLALDEVLPYVRHRLQVAGGPQELFNAAAGKALWEISQGIPRRINQLCDLALLVGFADELSSVGAVEIEAAAEELMSIAA